MESPNPSRRTFTKFAAAALGGLLAGVSTVSAEDEKPKKKNPKKPLLLQEPEPGEVHVCR